MGRKSRYESHVQPKLKEISEWYQILNETQIAKKLGISSRTFDKYKAEHKELREALKSGKETLVEELKVTLKKKAKGYKYTERKTIIRDENGKKVKVIEEYEKYAHPDLGAIHLLLKNNDPDWRNDDQTTIEMKKQKLKLEQERADNNQWS